MSRSKPHLPSETIQPRILVVDDDPELLEFLIEFFLYKGYSCDSANDGKSAYSKLQSNRYDLLVTDVAMPGMSGADLIKLVNQRWPSLPMIVLSGEGEFKTVAESLDPSKTFFFTKPFRDLEELDQVMRKAIGINIEKTPSAVSTSPMPIQKQLGSKSQQIHDQSQLRNEKYYRTLLENGNDGILLLDHTGRIIDLNQNAARLFGLTRSELLGKFVDNEVFRIELRLFFHQIREVGRQGGEIRYESELRGRDGLLKQIEIYSISNLNSELPEQVVYLRDITDFQRRLQTFKTRTDQLLESLGTRVEPVRFNSGTQNNFVEHANVFVFIVDRNWSILEWNPAAERISGILRGDAIHGGTPDKLFQNFESYILPSIEKTVFASGECLENFDTNINCADGIVRSLKWNISPVKEIGKTVGALFIGVDVTSEMKLRKELESYTSQLEETVGEKTRELSRSQERYRQLFESVPDAVFMAGTSGELLEVNPAWLNLLGCESRSEIQNKHFLHDFAVDPEEARKLLAILDTRKNVQDHVLQLRRCDGKQVTTLISIMAHGNQRSGKVSYEGIIRDITRLRQLEHKLVEHSQNLEEIVKTRSAELAESEAKFRRLIESSPDIIYRIDIRRMTYDYISPAATSITGYSSDKLRQIGPDGFVSRIHTKEASHLIDLWAQIGSEHSTKPDPFHIEYRFIRADGEIVWLSDRGSAIRSPSGELIAVEGVIRDITSQKSATVNLEEHATLLEQEVARRTAALAESEYRYRMLLGEAGDIIFTCNQEGKIQEINRRGEDLLGRGLKDINAKGFNTFLEESSRRRFNKALMSCFKAGIKPEPFQIEYQNPRGSKFLLEIQSSPLIIDDRVVLALMVARDLTSRRRAAQAIRTLKEFNEGIIHSMTEGIFIENDEGVCEFVNPAMAEMLGYKTKELEGRHYYEFVASADRDFVIAQRELCRLRGFVRYEVRLVGTSGDEIPVYISSRSKIENGNVVGALSVVTDLRQTKEMEGRQRFMERLLADERKLADIGMLAAGIAHNISSPLMVISGYAQLLKTKNSKMKEFDLILGQIDKISEITRNMMIKSRSEQDKGVKPIDINSLLQTELKFLEANLHFKSKVEKKYNFDPSIPSIEGVYSDFSQTFSNIVNNALDAMFNRPLRRLTVSTKKLASKIQISISDTGGGISQENINRIFDPFFTTKPPVGDVKEGEPSGTGLGLSTAQQLISNYGGRIFVESEPDAGTTFLIEIPVLCTPTIGSVSGRTKQPDSLTSQVEMIR